MTAKGRFLIAREKTAGIYFKVSERERAERFVTVLQAPAGDGCRTGKAADRLCLERTVLLLSSGEAFCRTPTRTGGERRPPGRAAFDAIGKTPRRSFRAARIEQLSRSAAFPVLHPSALSSYVANTKRYRDLTDFFPLTEVTA